MGYIKEIRPFLRWEGKKRQLLKYISLYYPFDGNITEYAEMQVIKMRQINSLKYAYFKPFNEI
ncbi:hypothetical protein HMPREF0629_00517 [Peptoniphilus sp. oral taxon 386 str. F0131]|nr:hypothetical protein HMPREF0629_00517 [Peptoniphilus sp. oral taxon 386 str. F0131]